MKVLLTNDDGIFAPGLGALRDAFEGVFDVSIVAPDREQSATGHGITVHRPLRAEEVYFPNCRIVGIAVDGTPSDCVKLAFDALEEKPNIVVSGINRGYNIGTDILYSGTVSAAVEGVLYGVPALAVSLETVPNYREDYRFAAELTVKMVRAILEHGLPENTLLNVNIPALAKHELAGVRVTSLGTRKYKNVFDKRRDPRGRTYYWLAGDPVDLDEGPDTDYTAIKNNFVSVTPVHFDLTRYDVMKLIEGWNLTID
jgi:5'-nucleotidase